MNTSSPPPIRFVFNERRTAAAASLLLELAGGKLPYLSLIKLLYFVDREALEEHGRSISGDRYVAMPHRCSCGARLDRWVKVQMAERELRMIGTE